MEDPENIARMRLVYLCTTPPGRAGAADSRTSAGTLLLVFPELGSDLVDAIDTETCVLERSFYSRTIEVARHAAERLAERRSFARFQPRGGGDRDR